VEALVSRHLEDAKKVTITGTALFPYRNVKIQSLYGSCEKQGFVKMTMSRVVCLLECPLGELPP